MFESVKLVSKVAKVLPQALGLRELMEEHVDEKCNVVYFCGSAGDDISALYHNRSPPKAPTEKQRRRGLAPLDVINENARILLDEDQGGFNEGTFTPVA